MDQPLTTSELNIVMDITFLFNSMLDLKLLSQRFLQMLGKLVPYEKAAVLLYHGARRAFFPCAEIRCDKTLIRDYIDRYSSMDYLGWLISQPDLEAFRESDKISPEEREKTRFYSGFLKAHEIHSRLIMNMESSEGSLLGVVFLFRSSVMADFSPREVKICQLLRPHLGVSVEHAIRFEELKQRGDLAQRVYHDITDVMMILNSDLSITYSNLQAEKYLEDLRGEPGRYNEFLSAIRNGCLELRDQYTAQRRQGPPSTREVPLGGGTAKISMIVTETIPAEQPYEFVIVFSKPPLVSAPASPPPTAPTEKGAAEDHHAGFFHTLGKQYSLTKREVKIMELAIEGLENQEIAQQLHISLFTVKSHFQNGYAKLGVKSRQELFLVYMKYVVSEEFRKEFQSQSRKDEFW